MMTCSKRYYALASFTVTFFVMSATLYLKFRPGNLQASFRNHPLRQTNAPIHINSPSIDWCKPLGFLPKPGPKVALASFPGSGNTWLRYLLQQATGILTGSVYMDTGLVKNGFPAENITNGSVIAIKTHRFGDDSFGDAAVTMFDRAILLVRDPFASLFSEFNRLKSGESHTGYAPAEYYRGNKWRSYVKKHATRWRKMNLRWFEAYNDKPGGLIVMAYEDLVLDPEKQLWRVLDFLDVKVPEASMRCAMERKRGIYKRAKKQALNFTIFDQEMTRAITVEKDIVYRKLGLSRPPVPPYLVASN